jgi:signal transduction histidine kinase
MAASDTSLAARLSVVGVGILASEAMWLRGAGATATLEHPAILVVAWLVGRDLLARQVQAEQSAALLAKADQLRAEQARLVEEQAKVAALDERARIAREIHDVLAHSLGALGLQLQAAQAVLTTQHDEARRWSFWPRPGGWRPTGYANPDGPCTPCATRPGRSRTG